MAYRDIADACSGLTGNGQHIALMLSRAAKCLKRMCWMGVWPYSYRMSLSNYVWAQAVLTTIAWRFASLTLLSFYEMIALTARKSEAEHGLANCSPLELSNVPYAAARCGILYVSAYVLGLVTSPSLPIVTGPDPLLPDLTETGRYTCMACRDFTNAQ